MTNETKLTNEAMSEDDLLLAKLDRNTPTAKVPKAGRPQWGAAQSNASRAWTNSGSVD